MHSQGGFGTRLLASAQRSDRIRYNLYLDPMGIRIWGDGAANTFVQQVPSGTTNLQIYAVVPGGQRVGVGSYSDMITVIVDW
jgi:spore coat protein U-like protein